NAELEKERAAAEAEVARRRADAEARVDRARAEYEQAAAALGLADRYRTAPDRRVIDRIERLREHIGNLGRRRHATREVRTRIEAASREGRALVHRLIGTDAPVGLPAPATEGDQVAAWAGLL